ncbi:hypothetical protein [Metapseudomonas otitidis]|uniref:hypothetical protein n=1 Tax=Metapseudomonas otitidis TaxID=319939 RepID=UPI0024472EC1|nr:hypothetical protein [Pseudomonas otitidis]MDH0335148.1 hypothetical protein [Pseudomonas otitidis]
MSKRTPGPWEARKALEAVYEQDFYIISSAGVVGYWKGGKSWHTDDKWVLTEADARLIAAAPCLLEALQAARWSVTMSGTIEVLAKVDAAIAKATGGDV